MTPFEREVKQIIADYKAELEECSSEYKRRCAKEDAFERLLEVAELYDE